MSSGRFKSGGACWSLFWLRQYVLVLGVLKGGFLRNNSRFKYCTLLQELGSAVVSFWCLPIYGLWTEGVKESQRVVGLSVWMSWMQPNCLQAFLGHSYCTFLEKGNQQSSIAICGCFLSFIEYLWSHGLSLIIAFYWCLNMDIAIANFAWCPIGAIW